MRTHAPQQTAPSFDHLVSAGVDGRRDIEAERLCGLNVDYQLVFCRRLYRQVGRFLAPENPVDVTSGEAILVCADPKVIGHQAAGIYETAARVDRGQSMTGRQRNDQVARTCRK